MGEAKRKRLAAVRNSAEGLLPDQLQHFRNGITTMVRAIDFAIEGERIVSSMAARGVFREPKM